MTFEIGLLLVIIAVAMVLFSIERFPADVVALGILLLIVVTGLLPAEEAFNGFGSDAVILILGLLIMTAALVRTGVVDIAGRMIVRRTGNNPNRLLGMVLTAPAVMSAFMSNTASTAFFLPIIIGLARRAKVSASFLLLPLAFSSILASSVTLIATSTNIVVSGLMVQQGMAPISMFELAPVGIPILLVGIAYMAFVGRRLIPDRGHDDEFEGFGSHPYLTETLILPGSPLIDKTIAASGLGRDLDLTVLRLRRGKKFHLAPTPDFVLKESDVLVLEGQRDEILKIKNITGLDIEAEVTLSDPSLQSEDVRLVEAIILPRSPFIGRTLKGLNFRERFSLQVLAINRHGETMIRRISQSPLQMGDMLLLQGRREDISSLEGDRTIRILGSLDDSVPNQKRAPIAVAAFLGAIALAALNIVALPVAVLLGALMVFVTRCITPEEAYREVEWKALILIGSMLGMGSALQHTGAAEYLAMQIVVMSGNASPTWLLVGFFLLAMLLTQPMSNQAAAVVVVPIAFQTALQLGVNPRTFGMMIAVGASCSFLTPLEPACLMVYGPGRYRFIDFLKVGAPLTLLILLIAIFLVPLIWPL